MDILSKISVLLEKGSWGKVTHPGILEVPEGTDVQQLKAEHFIELAKRKGEGAISKALMNLYRWNKKSNPELSSWARSMQKKVAGETKGK